MRSCLLSSFSSYNRSLDINGTFTFWRTRFDNISAFASTPPHEFSEGKTEFDHAVVDKENEMAYFFGLLLLLLFISNCCRRGCECRTDKSSSYRTQDNLTALTWLCSRLIS